MHACRQARFEYLPLVLAGIDMEVNTLPSFIATFFGAQIAVPQSAVPEPAFSKLDACTLLVHNCERKETAINVIRLATFLKENMKVEIKFFGNRIPEDTKDALQILLEAIQQESWTFFPPSRFFAAMLTFTRETSWTLVLIAKEADDGELTWEDDETRMKELERLMLRLGLYEPFEAAAERPGVMGYRVKDALFKHLMGSLAMVVIQQGVVDEEGKVVAWGGSGGR
jgi:hypothetical protein